jgi:probable rRNA maturation factor
VRVSFADSQNEVELDRARLRQLVKSLARGEEAKVGEVSLVFVDDAYIRELNARYLGVKRATDVIAFPLGGVDGPDEKDLLGEVYISTARAVAQARRHHVGLSQELARLVVHGVLHLLGYRDGTASARRVMIRQQETFLREHRQMVSEVARRKKKPLRRG